MDKLYAKLAAAGLIDEAGNIILERYANGTYQFTDKATFETFFGTAESTYEQLAGSHTFLWGDPPAEVTATAAQLGYLRYFDEWKAAGIL